MFVLQDEMLRFCACEMNYPDEIVFNDGELVQKLVRNKNLAAIPSGDSKNLVPYKVEHIPTGSSLGLRELPIYDSKDSRLSGVATGMIKIWCNEPLSKIEFRELEVEFSGITFERHNRIKSLIKGYPSNEQRVASLAAMQDIERRQEINRVSPEIIRVSENK